MKKVLIIGANSYIGNTFEQYINQLQEKQLVIEKVSARSNEWKNTDFTNYDVVLHLAGIAHQQETKEREADYYKVNRDLAIEVAKKATASKVEQFIFMSSASVFGSNIEVINKDTIPHPSTYYGKSKLEAEQEIIKLQNDSFHVAIVRPPMVYGRGCKGNFSKLVKLAKLTPIFPDIPNKRSMIYIGNLCEFLRLLILQGGWGYYHPQNEEDVCTSEMVKVIGENIGHRIYFTKVFNWLVQMLEKRVGVINKLFGDWYYEFDGAKPEEVDNDINIGKYQVTDFRESIQESLL